MYESGEIDRLLRFCGVRECDLEDLRQEVAVWLLTTREKVSNLPAYTVSLIRRQYYSRKSRWWKEEGAWKAHRVELPHAGGGVPDGDGGDMG